MSSAGGHKLPCNQDDNISAGRNTSWSNCMKVLQLQLQACLMLLLLCPCRPCDHAAIEPRSSCRGPNEGSGRAAHLQHDSREHCHSLGLPDTPVVGASDLYASDLYACLFTIWALLLPPAGVRIH